MTLYDPYIFEWDRLLDLEGELGLELVLLVELPDDGLAIEVNFVLGTLEHTLVQVWVAANYALKLLREEARGVVSLDHHEVVGLEVNLENEDEPQLALCG